ncbi:CSC1-like protein 1 [Cynoglossus semilaevis]|nr:CSC1-like protein 1 [Cynoglossus semilaevis]XP_008311945.1 CSC1-like protein 1 [Cynoglossus semilaevis]
MAELWYILTDTDAPAENASTCYSTTHSTVLSGIPFGGVPIVFMLYLAVFLFLGLLFSVLKQFSDHWRIAHFADPDNQTFSDEPTRIVQRARREDQREMGFISWLPYFLTLSEDQIKDRCGPDGVNYLSFQLHLVIALFLMNTFAMAVTLPVNMNGHLLGNNTLTFGRTTVANIRKGNNVIWLHTVIPIMHLLLMVVLLQHHTSKMTDSEITKNTLFISKIPKKATKEDIEAHFSEAYPFCRVSAVSLGFDVNKLMKLHTERVRIDKHLHFYKNIRRKTGIREMIEPSWLRRMFIGGEKVDAINHYRTKHKVVLEVIKKEAEDVPQHPLGIVFVTMKTETMANCILKDFNAVEHGSFFFGMEPQPSSHSQKLKVNKWRVKIAPHPQDLNWANLSVQGFSWFMRNVVLNIVLFLVLIFLTTPTIILNTMDKLDVTKTIEDLHSPIISEFFPTLLLCIFSLVLPTTVYYSTKVEGHWSSSSEQVSMMRKLYFFLIFMVLILPSLGLSSISVFFRWLLDQKFVADLKVRFECVFLPNQGAFFVNYVVAAALVGSGMELLRITQLLSYHIRLMLAGSDAGRKYIKENHAYIFSYGSAYGWTLCVFTVVMAYSVTCPVIVPCGLLYMLVRHLVDKFNLYYAYRQGCHSRKVHQAAVNQALAAPIISLIYLYYLSFLRIGFWGQRTLFLMVFLCVTIFICCGYTCFGYFKYLSPHKYKVIDKGKETEEEIMEAFVPKQLDPESYMDTEDNQPDIFDTYTV